MGVGMPGTQRGGEQPLIVRGVLIGRGVHCQIRVSDDTVSLMHAFAGQDSAGKFWIKDLGSHSGTFLIPLIISIPKRVGEMFVPYPEGFTLRIGRTELPWKAKDARCTCKPNLQGFDFRCAFHMANDNR